ncbi:MAG TPA: response regulator [Kofleriaceae bacterium]|nr:response regulator [Kofleriaceae bacterium]
MVLVVDDDSDLRETICDVLEAYGHRTHAARDGEEALAVLRREAGIEIVLLDLMMPIMNGWEFRASQLADRELARIPVVVMTAAADLTRSPIAAAQVLPKPVTTKALLDAIAQHALAPQ